MRRITSALFAALGLSAGLGQVALAADLPQRPTYVPVLPENHIRTYWWCSPARTGIAMIVPNR